MTERKAETLANAEIVTQFLSASQWRTIVEMLALGLPLGAPSVRHALRWLAQRDLLSSRVRAGGTELEHTLIEREIRD